MLGIHLPLLSTAWSPAEEESSPGEKRTHLVWVRQSRLNKEGARDCEEPRVEGVPSTWPGTRGMNEILRRKSIPGRGRSVEKDRQLGAEYGTAAQAACKLFREVIRRL